MDVEEELFGKNQDKIKFSSVHTMKTYWGIRRIAPPLLNFGAGWMGVFVFMSRPLYTPWGISYQLNESLGGLQIRYGRFGRRYISVTAGNFNPEYSSK
jgi:hypothetical protein